MATYSTHSAQRLLTCDFRLQRLFGELIKQVDHSILCGWRGKEEQDLAYETEHSKLEWPNSNHNINPSRAVDAEPHPMPEGDAEQIQALCVFAVVVKEQAMRLGIKIRWGGDWHGFKDYDHFELAE